MKNQRKNNILKKIIFTILIIILLRIGNIVPVPNVDQKYLVNLVNSNLTLKPFFNNKNIILSVFSVGIIPNLNASILIQYLTSSFSYFQKLQKEEGEAGSDGQNQLESIVNYLVMTQSKEHIIIWRALSKKSDELFLDRFL